jgi:hypothetical protein
MSRNEFRVDKRRLMPVGFTNSYFSLRNDLAQNALVTTLYVELRKDRGGAFAAKVNHLAFDFVIDFAAISGVSSLSK